MKKQDDLTEYKAKAQGAVASNTTAEESAMYTTIDSSGAQQDIAPPVPGMAPARNQLMPGDSNTSRSATLDLQSPPPAAAAARKRKRPSSKSGTSACTTRKATPESFGRADSVLDDLGSGPGMTGDILYRDTDDYI